MTTTQTRYISATETATLVRKALKASFPGQKFSVRTDQYAGGASIRIRWTDGPRKADVYAITNVYAGGRFDGSNDLAYSVSHYLNADGSVMLAKSPGSGASHPAIDNSDAMPADAEIVNFGANFVFCDRDISDREEKFAEAEAWIRQHCILEPGDRFLGRFVTDLAAMMVTDQAVGEAWEETFARR